MPGGKVLVAENEQKQRRVIVQRQTRDLSAWHGVVDRDKFFVWPIARDFERGNVISKRDFEFGVGPKSDLPNRECNPSAPTTRSTSR